MTEIPHWRLPAGVTRGLWDYTHSDIIADDYDDYFASNRLFQFDEQVLVEQLERHNVAPGGVVIDLGCGTGRALVRLARRGYRGLAIDLSQRMLGIVQRKARAENLQIECLRCNLVELDGLQDSSLDAATCLFSTLGMIRGRDYRQRGLGHVRRILKPGAPFVLHVHNYWYNLRDPGGPWWVTKGYLRAMLGSTAEPGDKFFSYRGVPNMFLHVFTEREICSDLRASGFDVQQIIPLDPSRHRRLRWPRLFGSLRANGWIITATAG